MTVLQSVCYFKRQILKCKLLFFLKSVGRKLPITSLEAVLCCVKISCNTHFLRHCKVSTDYLPCSYTDEDMDIEIPLCILQRNVRRSPRNVLRGISNSVERMRYSRKYEEYVCFSTS